MQSQIVESGVQLFSRLCHHTFCLNDINPKLFKNGGPLPNEIIEVAGDFSKDLLLDLMLRCILPKDLNVNWKGSGVVFVNCSHHISILKITNVIDAHLKNLNIKCRKPIIEKALSYITIFNCYNDEQSEITFRNLERIIQSKENVSLLIVDEITSHYWIAKQNNLKLSLDYYSKINLQILKSTIKNLNLVLVFSRYQLGNLKKSVDLHVDYKIIGEKIDSEQQQFTVIDYVRKTSTIVPFNLQTFITFL